MIDKWSRFAFMAPNDLSSLDWLSLEKIVRVRFNKAQRQRLLDALNSYLEAVAHELQATRIKTVRS